MDRDGQIWRGMVRYEQGWSDMDRNVDKNGKIWVGIVRYGQEW